MNATVAGVLNLQVVFEKVDDRFDDATLMQEERITPAKEALFHRSFELGDEMKMLPEEAPSQFLGEVAFITEQAAPKVFDKGRDGNPIIHIARRDKPREEFTLLVDGEVELEAIEPAHAGLAVCRKAGKHPMRMDAPISAPSSSYVVYISRKYLPVSEWSAPSSC